MTLGPVAKSAGLEPWVETGLYNRPDDWRVPDLAFSRPEHSIEAGIGSADLVIEIRSPHDETYDKLDWYVDRGVAEILVVDPVTRGVELFRSLERRLVLVQSNGDGLFALATLPRVYVASVETADGPRLRVTADAGAVDI